MIAILLATIVNNYSNKNNNDGSCNSKCNYDTIAACNSSYSNNTTIYNNKYTNIITLSIVITITMRSLQWLNGGDQTVIIINCYHKFIIIDNYYYMLLYY